MHRCIIVESTGVRQNQTSVKINKKVLKSLIYSHFSEDNFIFKKMHSVAVFGKFTYIGEFHINTIYI